MRAEFRGCPRSPRCSHLGLRWTSPQELFSRNLPLLSGVRFEGLKLDAIISKEHKDPEYEVAHDLNVVRSPNTCNETLHARPLASHGSEIIRTSCHRSDFGSPTPYPVFDLSCSNAAHVALILGSLYRTK